MRLKFIACKYTVFIQYHIPARNIFFFFIVEKSTYFRACLNFLQKVFIQLLLSFFKRRMNNI